MGGGELNWSTVYRMLRHSKRRALLQALDRNDEPLALADAAKEVVWLTSDTPDDEIDQSKAKKCSIALYHRHVPILTDGGFVTVEEDKTLNLTAKGEQLIEAQHLLEQLYSDST